MSITEDLFLEQMEFFRRQLQVDMYRSIGRIVEMTKVKTIKYKMLRKTGQYENDTAEAEVEVTGDVDDAIAEVKRVCARALGLAGAVEHKPAECTELGAQCKRAKRFGLDVKAYYDTLGTLLEIRCGSPAYPRVFHKIESLKLYLDGREDAARPF